MHSTKLYVIYNTMTNLFWDGLDFSEADITKAKKIKQMTAQFLRSVHPYTKAVHAPEGVRPQLPSPANDPEFPEAELLPALVQREDTGSGNDYILQSYVKGVWIEVEGISVHIWRSREGRTVDVELVSTDDVETVFASTLAAQPLRQKLVDG